VGRRATKHDLNWLAAQLLIAASAIEDGIDIAEVDDFNDND
jgi:hypothetical protein